MSIDHLQQMVRDQLPESITLDFKSAFSKSASDDFCKDVAAFANTLGGFLIYGIAEREGRARELCGTNLDDLDEDKFRLHILNWAATRFQPRFTDLRAKVIPLPDKPGKVVRIVEISRSWIGPHAITNIDVLHYRTDAGNQKMDVFQMREAFTQQARIEKAKEVFFEERAPRVRELLPRANSAEPWGLLHILSSAALRKDRFLSNAEMRAGENFLRPIDDELGFNDRPNYGGYLRYKLREQVGISSYVQLFRTGAIEYAFGLCWNSAYRYVRVFDVERWIFDAAVEALGALNAINIEPPYFLFLKLSNMRGVNTVPQGVGHDNEPKFQFWNSDLLFPELQLTSSNRAELSEKIKLWFDIFAQAGGRDESMSFNTQGEFTPR
jgi:hypothetical protein